MNLRQIEIVLELCEHAGNYFSASYFAKKQQVSLRTIQNDIKQIKGELSSTTGILFESIVRKGYRITILDNEAFPSIKEFYYKQFTSSSKYENGRISQLLLLLLEQHRAMSLYDIESKVFVSHSTLLNDFKTLSDIIECYGLELLRNSNKVFIDGSEVNKRLCMLEQNLIVTDSTDVFLENMEQTEVERTIERLKNILVETFVTFKHPVNQVTLNNSIMQLYVALRRMQTFFYITSTDLEIAENLAPERDIAEEIYKRISETFSIRIPEAEIDYFALYMKGQGDFSSGEAITDEVDNLVLSALNEINEAVNIDLTSNLNLRIALALHVAPLIVRIKYDMQLKNHLVGYIRQTFPQGFDLGMYFAAHLQKKLHRKVSDEEVAFIAIHLYSALKQKRQEEGTKKILVISSMRQSENILLQQTLLNWLSDEISDLVFLSPTSMPSESEELASQYDIILTTEKGKYYDSGFAFYINPFPNQQDYLNLRLAVDGFKSIDDIISIFHKELFFVHNGDNRENILKILCESATEYFNIEDCYLHKAVTDREQLGSTFFGNGIAAPHPISAVSPDSFVAVSVLPQPVVWDDDKNTVNLVLMVCIGKNNTKAFHLWNYLSSIFANRGFVEQLVSAPSYTTFIRLLKETISDNFQKK